MMWLLDKNEQLSMKLNVLSALHTEVINAENTLTFECKEIVEKSDRIIYKDRLNKYHEFIVQEVTETRESNIVYAEHSSYEMHGDWVENKRPTGTARYHLETILGNSRWKLGVIEGTDSRFQSYYRQSVYRSISDICTQFNLYRDFEIIVEGRQITNRLINLKTMIGYDEGKRFVNSKDLKNVTRTILIGEVITALYGFGKGEQIGDGYGRRIDFGSLDKPDSPVGQMFISDDKALQEWGRNSINGKQHVFASYEFDDIEDKEELYYATRNKLQEMKVPRVNYQCDVLLLDDFHENVGIGDTVAIIDKNFRGKELRIKGKVFKIERDLIEGLNSKVEIGNFIDNLSDENNKLINFVNDFRDKTGVWDKANAFDGNGVLDSSYIKNILEGWNNQMNGTSGFVYGNSGEGLITYDRAIDDNPTMAIQIIGGGWRIANSRKSDGTWDWRTLGTGDGLYGDQIIANSITVNQLHSDVGTSLDISSNKSIKLVTESVEEVQSELGDNKDKIEAIEKETIENTANIILNSQGIQMEATERELLGERLETEMKSALQLTSDSLSLIISKIADDQSLTDSELQEFKTYFRWDANGSIIGKEGHPITLHQTNSGIEIQENGTVIAFWEQGTMSVDNLIAKMSIVIGTHLAEKYESPTVGTTTIWRMI